LTRIYNFKYQLKQDKTPQTLTNLVEFELFLKKYEISNFNPNVQTTDFIILYFSIGNGTQDNPFIVVFSSFTLLKYALKQQELNKNACLLGIDSTFKLNTLRYPLIVMATQDLQNHVFQFVFRL